MNIERTIEALPKIYIGFFNYLKKNPQIYLRDTVYNRKNNITPDSFTGVLSPAKSIIQEFVKYNKEIVLEQIQSGERDSSKLIDMLSNWERVYEHNEYPKFTYLGFRLTTECNLYGTDRCRYCNQKRYAETLDPKNCIRAAEQISNYGKRRGIYASVSGGEPLILGNDYLYGEQGVLSRLGKLGFTINMNSNLHMLSPSDAVSLINSGVANLHVSIDSSVKSIHDGLAVDGAFERVITSIRILQLTKILLGVSYPNIHINVVGTKDNLIHYDKLLELLLECRTTAAGFSSFGSPFTNPGRMDMSPHLIPLGGVENTSLLPTEEDWTIFNETVLPNCRTIWNNYLLENGVELTDKNTFDNIHFYANPFARLSVGYRKNENDMYPMKCYAAPTQLSVMPNGDCYPCSCQSDHKDGVVIGNIYKESPFEIIKRNRYYLYDLPYAKECERCPRSAININRMVENKLKAYVKKWIEDEER